MKRTKLPYALGAAFGLAFFAVGACAVDGASTSASLAAAGEALTAADTVAMAYVTLPLCPAGATSGPGGTLCSQAVVSAKIKAAASAAYTAYKTAEASQSTGDLAAAVTAINALATLMPTQAKGAS